MFVRSLTPMAKLSVWPQVQEQLQIRPPKKSRRPLQIQRQRQVQNANREIGVPRGAGLTLWQAGAQPFEPALPVLRMNRAVARFTSSAPTETRRESINGSSGR